MEKRGLSNIEMVLAFIIFIGAVLFAVYFFLNHFNQNQKENSLDFVNSQIVSNLNAEVKSYSVKINRSAFPNDQEILAVNINTEIALEENIAAFDFNGVSVPIDLVNGIVYLNVSKSGDLFKIEISKEISRNYTLFSNLPASNENYYNIASNTKNTLPSEMKVEELNKNYYLEYDKLKSDLGINRGFDFGFEADFAGNNVKMEKDISKQDSVFVSNKRIEFLRKNGKIEFTDVKTKVW